MLILVFNSTNSHTYILSRHQIISKVLSTAKSNVNLEILISFNTGHKSVLLRCPIEELYVAGPCVLINLYKVYLFQDYKHLLVLVPIQSLDKLRFLKMPAIMGLLLAQYFQDSKMSVCDSLHRFEPSSRTLYWDEHSHQ